MVPSIDHHGRITIDDRSSGRTHNETWYEGTSMGVLWFREGQKQNRHR